MKTSLLFLIITLSWGVGCNSSSNAVQYEMNIAYIAKLPKESFHDGIANGVKKEASKLKIHVDIFPAKSQQDVSTQREKLQDIAQRRNYQGVLLAPNNSQALIEDVRALNKANIPVVLVDTPLAESDESRQLTNICGFVGTDNALAGKLAAKFVASELPRGNILLMRGNHGHRSSIDREKGFREEIAKYPLFKIVDLLSGLWETEESLKVFSKYMSGPHKSFDAVFAYSDPMALGVSLYYSQKNLKSRPLIVGVDGVLLGQQAVLSGKTDATVVQAPEMMGEIATHRLYECITQGPVTATVVLTPVTLLKASRTLEMMANP